MPSGEARHKDCGLVTWRGPGDPWWKGPPDVVRIRRIYSLTTGFDTKTTRRYFRRAVHLPWELLRSPESFRILNQILDQTAAVGR